MMEIKNFNKTKLVKDNNYLRVNNLSSFYKKKKTLNDISINVKEGEIVGLLDLMEQVKQPVFSALLDYKILVMEI